MDYKKEQKDIVETVESCKAGGGTKSSGDLCCNVIKSYLEKYSLNKNVEIIGPHVFINEIPNEIDLMPINKEAKPEPFIERYDIKDVNVAIEIKKIGIIATGKEGLKKELGKTKEIFDQVTKKNPDVKCCYLAVSEVIPIRSTSRNFVEESKDVLKPYKVFALSNRYKSHPQLENDWGKFLKELNLI